MPNWCANQLTALGSEEEIELLNDTIESSWSGDNEKEDPESHRLWHFRSRPSDEDAEDNPCLVTPTQLRYIYITRWSPIEQEDIAKFFKRFPSMKYTVLYAERGSEFVGEYGSNGRCYEQRLTKKSFVEKKKADDVSDEEDDEDELVPELAKFQHLYNISG